MGMKAYPSYRDCILPWLPAIPSHWEIHRLGAICNKKNRIARSTDNILICSNNGTVFPRNENTLGLISDKEEAYQGVEEGDLLIHGMDTWHGAIAVSKYSGKCTKVVHVCESSQNKSFVAYFLQMLAIQNVYKAISNGVRGNTSDFRSWNKARIIIIAYPPTIEEQNAIVAYLDKKCAEIDKLVSRRLSIIERLRELKQSIIAEAVTKGLSPKVPMKDSGTAWQGKVPAHWEKFRNKNELIPKVNHIGDNPNKLPMLSLTKKGIIVRDLDSGKGKFSADESKFLIVEPGDFVFCHYDIQETPRTVGLSTHLGYITGSYNVYGYKGTNSRFFYYLHEYFDDGKLLCPLYRGLRNTIRQDRFLSMQIFLPPADEQAAIVSYLDKKCAEIDELVARQEQIIEKLKELKTSTIAHVVTGKVDVRDAI